MKKLLPYIAVGFLYACVSSPPEMPNYATSKGEECAMECRNDYADCMENELRPDFLILSPRKKACRKGLRECYQFCLDKEKQEPSTSTQ